MISKSHAVFLIFSGVALVALFGVLDYTLGEPPFNLFWPFLAVWGIASTALGLHRFISHIYLALVVAVSLVAIGYGFGLLINSLVVDSFGWPKA